MEWLEHYYEPYFEDRVLAEGYIEAELPRALPEGWCATRLDPRALDWRICRTGPPGEWQNQDYQLMLSAGLDLLIVLYGNKDIGPFDLHQAFQHGMVLRTSLLRAFTLKQCLEYVFDLCAPNQWGYT